jgi:hypothetical protein
VIPDLLVAEHVQHPPAQRRIAELAARDALHEPGQLARGRLAEAELLLVRRHRLGRGDVDLLVEVRAAIAERREPAVDRAHAAEPIDREVRRGVVAERDHQRERVLERELEPAVEARQHAGSGDLVLVAQRDRRGERDHPRLDLVERLDEHRELDRRRRPHLPIRLEFDRRPRPEVPREQRHLPPVRARERRHPLLQPLPPRPRRSRRHPRPRLLRPRPARARGDRHRQGAGDREHEQRCSDLHGVKLRCRDESRSSLRSTFFTRS